MKFDFTLPLVVGSLAYAFWYFWFYCVQKGDRVYIAQGQPIPAIYPPPPGFQAPPQDLPLYLPRPPLLPGPGNDTCGFPCGIFSPPNCNTNPPPICQALPLCVAGTVNNPLTCGCTPECDIVNGTVNPCPANSRWNWCVKGCVPSASLIPDCAPPAC